MRSSILYSLWILSPLVLLPLWLRARAKLKRYRAAPPPPPGWDQTTADEALQNLLLLRIELMLLAEADRLSPVVYAALLQRLDPLWQEALGFTPASDRWRQCCQKAWEQLFPFPSEPSPAPPWENLPAPTGADAVAGGERKAPFPAALPEVSPPTSVPPASPVPPASAIPPAAPSLPPASSAPTPLKPAAVSSVSRAQDTADFAWEPVLPSPLEQVLQRLSGWPKLAAPFLAQHIGWFIGGFCFVAGTLFLVSYTSGFANALVIQGSVFTYTVALLLAGYQLRRRRPELRVASSVLLTFSMLLVPLNITAAVRLVQAGAGSLAGLSVAVAVSVLVTAACYGGAQLVSGILDRSLQGRHAPLFLAVAALQFGVPVVTTISPPWLGLALFHGLLLGLVGYGLLAFTRRWVKEIFEDQRRVAYYASGLLIYATVVSYLHLTWSYPGRLPDGYYGPFLMALAGLLFYADAALKEWQGRYVLLSHFTLFLYGLSMLAVVLCIAAPLPRLITLTLAVGIYGLVIVKYLTVPPLYLLLGAAGGLYGTLVLAPVPFPLWLLAGLPGFAALFGLVRWLKPRSLAMACAAFRILALLFLGLTGWSLYHASAGLTALATGFTSTLLGYLSLALASDLLPGDPPGRFLPARGDKGPWMYLVTLLAAVTFAYVPPWPGLPQEIPWAVGLFLLAILWSRLGLHAASKTQDSVVEALINSALLLMGLAVGLGILALGRWDHPLILAGLLAGSGILLVWLALGLRFQGLVYAGFLSFGSAGLLLPGIFLPQLSPGGAALLMALFLWCLLWWFAREPPEAAALRRSQAWILERQPRLRIFWRFRAYRPGLPDPGYSGYR